MPKMHALLTSVRKIKSAPIEVISDAHLFNILYLLYGSVSQGLGTTKFTNLIG